MMMRCSFIHKFLTCLALLFLSACGSNVPFINTDPQANKLALTPAQECAISYDMARQIYKKFAPTKTIIYAKAPDTTCEKRTLQYLADAGFRIDGTTNHPEFNVELLRIDFDTIHATANLHNRFTLTRSYQPTRAGVIALTPLSMMEIPSEVSVHYEDR